MIERPSIVVATHDSITHRHLREILLGIEEEGVPFRVERSDELNPLALAHEASLDSEPGSAPASTSSSSPPRSSRKGVPTSPTSSTTTPPPTGRWAPAQPGS